MTVQVTVLAPHTRDSNRLTRAGELAWTLPVKPCSRCKPPAKTLHLASRTSFCASEQLSNLLLFCFQLPLISALEFQLLSIYSWAFIVVKARAPISA